MYACFVSGAGATVCGIALTVALHSGGIRVVPLAVRDDDDPIIAVTVCGGDTKSTSAPVVLGGSQRIPQCKPASRRNLIRLLVECVNVHPFGSFAEQNSEPRRSLKAIMSLFLLSRAIH